MRHVLESSNSSAPAALVRAGGQRVGMASASHPTADGLAASAPASLAASSVAVIAAVLRAASAAAHADVASAKLDHKQQQQQDNSSHWTQSHRCMVRAKDGAIQTQPGVGRQAREWVTEARSTS